MIRFINRQRIEQEEKVNSASDFENETFENQPYRTDLNQNDTTEKRKPFRHQQFQNEDEFEIN